MCAPCVCLSQFESKLWPLRFGISQSHTVHCVLCCWNSHDALNTFTRHTRQMAKKPKPSPQP